MATAGGSSTRQLTPTHTHTQVSKSSYSSTAGKQRRCPYVIVVSGGIIITRTIVRHSLQPYFSLANSHHEIAMQRSVVTFWSKYTEATLVPSAKLTAAMQWDAMHDPHDPHVNC